MAYTQITEWRGELFTRQLRRALDELDRDVSVKQAEAVVLSTYGDTVSVAAKGKNLNKFGRNVSLGTTDAVIMTFQGSEVEETFGATNICNSVISSSASDTALSIPYEGVTIDGSGNLTFITTTVVTNGQTRVALPTPLWAPTRARLGPSGVFGSPQSLPAGNISFYNDADGDDGSGVPSTDSAVQLILPSGQSFTEKAATSISQSDYWFIRQFYIAVDEGTKTADTIFARMQMRDVKNGGNWVPVGEPLTLDIGFSSYESEVFDPLEIVPPNHAWRIIGRTNAGTASTYAGARGVLAAIQ